MMVIRSASASAAPSDYLCAAHHGYLAICANLYERAGQGKVRADGGISDAQMVGDTEAAVKWVRAQSNHNGKVGVFGSCSGGRHASSMPARGKTSTHASTSGAAAW